MSIDVLGRLVEIWSEQDFATFLDKEILEPLQMVDTAFYVPQEKEGRRVTIYTSGKDKPTEFSAAPENSKVPRAVPAFCMPGGGLYSTATDYFRFLRMNPEWRGMGWETLPETRDSRFDGYESGAGINRLDQIWKTDQRRFLATGMVQYGSKEK